MTISNFYENTTKIFDVTIYYDGVLADISADTVTLYIKEKFTDADDESIVTSVADVATAGASGVATFTLSDDDTDIPIRKYHLEIVWETDAGYRFVVHQQTISCLNKLQDNA